MIGRVRTFSIMLGSQVLAFGLLAHIGNPWLFAGLLCYVLLCYGGGFGTMPSLVLDRFGATRMPVIYGAMLTAWSLAGIVGPQMVGVITDHWPAEAGYYSFLGGAGFVAVGFGLTLLLRETTAGRECGRTGSRGTGA
jgi:OFA family oxalate/formate antiporter-like MFS transporter